MTDPAIDPPAVTPPPLTDEQVADLCFTARALAQTHPMTEGSLRYRQGCFERERERQPVPELADWAGTALLVGYCLRRAEERLVAMAESGSEGRADVDELAERANVLAAELRSGDADRVTLIAGASLVAALDRIIGTELDKRRDHLREQLDDEAWSELEAYISWWAVHGYGVRAAETGSPDR
ncbi:MAG: hypothetical protein ACR2QK_14035 [Acidimicrobiales bacterium]